MANMPNRRHTSRPARDTTGRPKIWVDGSQRPPFDLRALARSCLYFARSATGFLAAGVAGWLRQVALGVRDGRGRLPAARLGRMARFVPSHLRVAMWVRNLAALIAHASATADPDFVRGNALVAEIEAPLWPEGEATGKPPSPGPAAATAIQIIGYIMGWAANLLLLPYGLIRALVAFVSGRDLRKTGLND